MRARRMREGDLLKLTADHVAFVHRDLEDPPPDAGLVEMTDAEYGAIVDAWIAANPDPDFFWVFAYGSLLWMPVFEPFAELRGIVHGWHRAFCMHMVRGRGSPDNPGLMMALDRGGQCHGIACKLKNDASLRDTLDKLARREMRFKPLTNVWATVNIRTAEGMKRGIAFVADRKGTRYIKLSEHDVVERLASGVGGRGSCAEYLYKTVLYLDQRGIRDRNLWRLQALVADRIAHRRRAG